MIRRLYLNKLEMYVDRNVVKLITGVRRSGKTTIVRQFISELIENGVPEERIFYINFEGVVYAYFKKAEDLRTMLASFIESVHEEHCYIFLDELACVEGWEEVIAELLNLFDCDIYITSSNNSIFKNDYAKKLNYRYVKIDVYPLTFSEYMELTAAEANALSASGTGNEADSFINSSESEYAAGTSYAEGAAYGSDASGTGADNASESADNGDMSADKGDARENNPAAARLKLLKRSQFEDYLRRGCMPGAYAIDAPDNKSDYLRNLYNTILLKDVVQCNKLRDISHLDKIMEYILSHIGETFSPKSLRDYVKSHGITISVDTVYSFLDALTGAFLIYKVPRFDIKADRELETHEKYYICDMGMRNAVMGDEGAGYEAAIENALCLELLTRGFKLYVGKNNQAQIDFMAVRGTDRTYLNCCPTVEDKDAVKQKFGPLTRVRDNYFKMVLSTDTETKINKGGIINYPIQDFLSQG